MEKCLNCQNENSLAEKAEAIAEKLKGGEVILLEGAQGAGKTLFARALIRKLCGDVAVQSPTFPLLQYYAAPDFAIWHMDFYRLKHFSDLEALALDDAPAEAVFLVEWPHQTGKDWSDKPCLEIKITIKEDKRMISFKTPETLSYLLAGGQ